MSGKPKIRKALFIGLGGTGAMSLIALKKRFMEVYGHVDAENASLPEFVKFMVFDTDAEGTRNKSKAKARNAVSGKVFDVEFMPSEVIPMKAPDCGEFIMAPHNKDQFEWMPLENLGILNALNDLDKGAGQVRLFGRVAHFFNIADVRNALSDGVDEVRLASQSNVHFEPLGDDMEVHVVASLAGGTGSGMFMDVGMLLREILESRTLKANINGYFVLPDIFWSVASRQDMKRVKPNSIGALKELDFFMEMIHGQEAKAQKSNGNENRMTEIWDPETSPLHESEDKSMPYLVQRYIGGEEVQLMGTPYSHVYLIDSENRDEGTFNKVEELAATISKGLFASVTSMSVGLQSVDDNDKDKHYYNHKLGWVGSLGVSELVYNLPEVKLHLALRVIDKGLSSLLQSSEDMASKAQVIMEDSGLTEVGDRSDLVNAIYKSSPLQAKELYDDADPAVERSAAMAQVAKCYDTLQAEADGILSKAIQEMDGLDKHLPDAGRIDARIELLEEVKSLAVSFKEEVKADREKLKARLEEVEKGLYSGMDSTETRLKELLGASMVKRMLKKREIEDESNAWQEETYELMQLTLRDEAMEKALHVLDGLANSVDERIERFKKEQGYLVNLQTRVKGQVNQRNRSGISRRKATPFLLQMHCDDMNAPFELAEMNNWNASAFLNGISQVVTEKDSDEWVDAACAFVESQHYSVFTRYTGEKSQQMTRSLLGEKLDAAKGEQQPQYTEIGKLISDLMKMSSPMIKIDPGSHTAEDGRRLTDCMRKAFVICVPADTESDLLVTEIEKMAKQLADNVGQVTIKVHPVPDQSDRVTIYQRLTGAPVCALAGFSLDYQEYVRRHKPKDGEVFHVNYNWYNTMKEVKHSLTEGVSVSGEQALENWTKALLLGYIKWDGKAWRINPGKSKAESVKQCDRYELFKYLMEECDYGAEVEEMLRYRMQNSDPAVVKNALNEVLQRDKSGIVDFKLKADDEKNGKAYFGDPNINPYVLSRTDTDIYGEAAYNRLGQKNSLELLKEEGECLKALFEKGA